MTSPTKLGPMTHGSLTWIDALMAADQRAGWPADDVTTGRWSVSAVASSKDFMVLHESGSGDSMGGDDTTYSARVVAAAIDRWSAPSVGVESPPEFFAALRYDAVAAELNAEEARVEAVRCRGLYDNMRARGKVAEAEAVQRGWNWAHSPSLKTGAADLGD
ncbi:hypothetical protein [Sphingomonas sp.]|uniref:hypothetical protein n=1 Tax=Sphingomonas sp. TaxID=28214 RepID=UPI0018459F80|nr:hypothetical protein [Sphingomonas sp.]MBA3510853.1 hypothetical protein [Sphingomonas sp.]